MCALIGFPCALVCNVIYTCWINGFLWKSVKKEEDFFLKIIATGGRYIGNLVLYTQSTSKRLEDRRD